ncbi:MAG: NRDE family protein, partial [Syntrophales bacterium]|nr:NRDE family protein [Syntrophales bacterium]
MCLIIFAYRSHHEYPLIIAANRDEYYGRPTEAASFWEDNPDVLGGRDLRGGGTWMGIHRTGRLAAITNYRDLRFLKHDAPSRG